MFLSPRLLAGYTLTGAAFALAAMSGMVSFTGISALLPSIPGIGFLGFVIAVTTISLGIAVIADAVDRNWKQVAVYGALLGLVALSDGYTNILALQGQVSEAEQASADRNQKFEAATETLAITRDEIAGTHDLIALMNANDPAEIKEAQTYLASKGLYLDAIDGIRGGQTLAAMRAEGAALSSRLEMLQAREDALIPVVSAGADVVEAPFTLEDAALYGVVITAFGIALSFAGSALINTGKAMEDREADVSEREVDLARFEDELEETIEEDAAYAHAVWETTYAIRRSLEGDAADVADGEATVLSVADEADDVAHLPADTNFMLTVKGERAVREARRERELADNVLHDDGIGDKIRAA